MADKERIYRIKFEGLESQVSNLANLKKSVDDLKTAKKNLDKSTEEGRIADEKLTLEIKNLNKQYQEQQKEVEKMDKLNQKQGDTLEKMRAKLSLMRKDLEGMQVGSKVFNDQTKAVEGLQKKINMADEASGRFNGNVGNYSNSIQDAFKRMGINMTGVTEAINTAKVAMVGMEVATNKGAFAMKILKIAIASTGIGILIVAIGELAAYFSSSGERADKFAKIIAPFKQLFNGIQAAVFGFIDSISVAFDWISKITGLIGDEQQKQIDKDRALSKAKRESVLEEAELNLERSKLLKQMTEKATRDSDERMEIAKKALAIDDQIFEHKIALAKRELESILENNKLKNKVDGEAKMAAVQAEAELVRLETEKNDRQRKTTSRLQSLLLQDMQMENKKTDAIVANAEKEKKAKEDYLQFYNDYTNSITDDINRIIDEAKKLLETDLLPEPEKIEKEVTVPDIDQDPEVDYWRRKAAERIEIERQSLLANNDQIREAVSQHVLTEAEGEAAINANKRESYAATAQIIGQATTLFKKNTIAYRALATAEATINTYLSATKAYAALVGLGPMGPVLAAIAAAVAIATGLASVAKINNVKLAKGGIVGGQLHEQGGTVYRGSDGQSFEAERGELIAVVNRRDTERLKVLSAANSVHGRPFFAAGGMIQPNTQFLNQDFSRVMAETVSQIASIPVVVSERDITRSQRRVSIIENSGNL